MENKTILEDYEEILGNKKLTNGQEKALLSAINLFAKQGYDATSTAQIAKNAGISEATIFKYYSTKEKLLLEIINLITTELFPKFQRKFFSEVNEVSDKSLKEIITHPVSEWKEQMVNDFEASVFPQYPVIGEIKEELYKNGAMYAAMSGSGSSVFGLFAPDITIPDINFGERSFVFKGKL